MPGSGGGAYIVGIFDLISTGFVANSAAEEGMAIFVAVLSAVSQINFKNVSFANNALHCPPGYYGNDATDAVSTCREKQW